jgi:hypothetical protein
MPPPAQITTTLLLTRSCITPVPRMRRGSGDGTERRNPPPSGMNVHPVWDASRSTSEASKRDRSALSVAQTRDRRDRLRSGSAVLGYPGRTPGRRAVRTICLSRQSCTMRCPRPGSMSPAANARSIPPRRWRPGHQGRDWETASCSGGRRVRVRFVAPVQSHVPSQRPCGHRANDRLGGSLSTSISPPDGRRAGERQMAKSHVRRNVIREWMSHPRDKRSSHEQTAAFAKTVVQQHRLPASRRDRSEQCRDGVAVHRGSGETE